MFRLRCNRRLPCDTCIRRGKADICQYAPNADRSKADAKRAPVSVQLKRLEDMIANLTQSNGGPSNHVDPELDHVTQHLVGGLPQTQPEPTSAVESDPGQQPSFIDSSHWLSILEDIKDIREQLSPGKSSEDDESGNGGSSFPDTSSDAFSGFGAQSYNFGTDLGLNREVTTTLKEVLSGLPPRNICDFWVSHYFGSKYMMLPIVHPVKFQAEVRGLVLNNHRAVKGPTDAGT